MPRRANSSCVAGWNPAGALQLSSARRLQPGGMKSHAVRMDGAGIPGASGDEKLHAVPMRAGFAKLPGVVP